MVPVLATKERDERGELHDHTPMKADDGRVNMRWKAFLVSVIVVAWSFTPSVAQVRVDMNQITCRDWLGYGPGVRNSVRFWMVGYYSGAFNNTVMDYNRLQRGTAKVVAYCRRHGSSNLPTAIQNTQ